MIPRTIVLGLVFVLAACGSGGPDDETPPFRAKNRLEQAHLRQLARAVDSVEWALGSLQDGGGYQQWTPSSAVPQLIASLNAANAPMPGEPNPPGPPISFVAERCSGPWQVVLAADDATTTIHVQGFAADCSEAATTTSFTVPRF